MIEFRKLPSLSRLFRDMTITEKIDGTQSTVIFERVYSADGIDLENTRNYLAAQDGAVYEVGSQSKNRLLHPGKQSDNYGFAEWVLGNRYELFNLLGPGRHSGEWWGQGVQRHYGLSERRWSLFNPTKLGESSEYIGGALVGSVPVLYEGPFDTARIEFVATQLRDGGSVAAPGFAEPEGVVVFHVHSGQSFKFTLDNNDKHKWEEIGSDLL